MRRIGLAVGLALSLTLVPFAADGQRAERMPHVGLLGLGSAEPSPRGAFRVHRTSTPRAKLPYCREQGCSNHESEGTAAHGTLSLRGAHERTLGAILSSPTIGAPG